MDGDCDANLDGDTEDANASCSANLVMPCADDWAGLKSERLKNVAAASGSTASPPQPGYMLCPALEPFVSQI